MANQNLDALIRDCIDSFVADVTLLVKRAALESVQDALSEGSPAARRGVRRRGRPAGKGRRGRRSSADLEAISSSVLAHVKSNPGQRLEQIAKALNRPTSILKRPVAKLVAAKQLKTKGQKRGMTYTLSGRRRRRAG